MEIKQKQKQRTLKSQLTNERKKNHARKAVMRQIKNIALASVVAVGAPLQIYT